MKERRVTFRVLATNRTFDVTGQTAKALVALVAAGERGCTALEVASWALRFAHYVLCLRRLGLQIDMGRELHPGGWHGRYWLRSGVEILEISEVQISEARTHSEASGPAWIPNGGG